MKAILIDPEQREVKGIEIDPARLNEAFGSVNKKVLLLSRPFRHYQTVLAYHEGVIYYDGTAQLTCNPGQPMFQYAPLNGQVIFGKGLILSYIAERVVGAIFTAREVECSVQFIS